MNHIVDTCPLTQFEGGLNQLHEADDDAVVWLESFALHKQLFQSNTHFTVHSSVIDIGRYFFNLFYMSMW